MPRHHEDQHGREPARNGYTTDRSALLYACRQQRDVGELDAAEPATNGHACGSTRHVATATGREQRAPRRKRGAAVAP